MIKPIITLGLLLIGPLAAAQDCVEASWRKEACPNLVYRATPQEPLKKMVCICTSDFDYLNNYRNVNSFAAQNLLSKELQRLGSIHQLEPTTLRKLLGLPISH
ncbi:hypothetical protein [Ferrimonas lipolytica]|uniref:Uncharacterized protein n=1 Tax=Ferrimonas lipolytica TaxID=2724191 RepID=A0A6H1U9L2_9GAMM|nr:hypothetical protein [Ferrimonas lipolytica]QIZ75518.1 hypothetical protein HER31_00530 [Ferrimonas lipolytica]